MTKQYMEDSGKDTHVYGKDTDDFREEAEFYEEDDCPGDNKHSDEEWCEFDDLSVEEMYDFLNQDFRSEVSELLMKMPLKVIDGRLADENESPVATFSDENWIEAENALMLEGQELWCALMKKIGSNPLAVTDERLKMFIECLLNDGCLYRYERYEQFLLQLRKRDFLSFFRILDGSQHKRRLRDRERLRKYLPENCTLDDEVVVSDQNLALYFLEKASKFESIRTGRLAKLPYSNSQGEVVDKSELEPSDQGLFQFNPALSEQLQELIFEGLELLGSKRAECLWNCRPSQICKKTQGSECVL